MNREEQNEKLRKEIVDLADLWDGPESERYGQILQNILDNLGIKDTPEFYKKENMDRLLQDIHPKEGGRS
jgi:hypothetical protein